MRKRLLALGVVLAVALLVGVVLRGHLTTFRARYDRVRPGMTRDEVRALLGEPVLLNAHGDLPGEEAQAVDVWASSGAKELAYVHFTDGRVGHKAWHEEHEPTSLERVLQAIRQWLGW
jgi:hypothetical protein